MLHEMNKLTGALYELFVMHVIHHWRAVVHCPFLKPSDPWNEQDRCDDIISALPKFLPLSVLFYFVNLGYIKDYVAAYKSLYNDFPDLLRNILWWALRAMLIVPVCFVFVEFHTGLGLINSVYLCVCVYVRV